MGTKNYLLSLSQRSASEIRKMCWANKKAGTFKIGVKHGEVRKLAACNLFFYQDFQSTGLQPTAQPATENSLAKLLLQGKLICEHLLRRLSILQRAYDQTANKGSQMHSRRSRKQSQISLDDNSCRSREGPRWKKHRHTTCQWIQGHPMRWCCCPS